MTDNIDIKKVVVRSCKLTLLTHPYPTAIPNLPDTHPFIPYLIIELWKTKFIDVTCYELLFVDMNNDILMDYLWLNIKQIFELDESLKDEKFSDLMKSVLFYSPDDDFGGSSKFKKHLFSMIRKQKNIYHVVILGFEETIKNEFNSICGKRSRTSDDGSWAFFASQEKICIVFVFASSSSQNKYHPLFISNFDFFYEIQENNFYLSPF